MAVLSTMPKQKVVDIDMSEYNFSKLAATYFNSTATNNYSKRPLKKSLLDHPLPMDEISAQSVWIMILRFMGDMAEAKYDGYEDEDEDTVKSSIMQRLTVNLAKSNIQNRDFQEAVAFLGETDHQRLIRKTLKSGCPSAMNSELM